MFEEVSEGQWLCEIALWVHWWHRGQLSAQGATRSTRSDRTARAIGAHAKIRSHPPGNEGKGAGIGELFCQASEGKRGRLPCTSQLGTIEGVMLPLFCPKNTNTYIFKGHLQDDFGLTRGLSTWIMSSWQASVLSSMEGNEDLKSIVAGKQGALFEGNWGRSQ